MLQLFSSNLLALSKNLDNLSYETSHIYLQIKRIFDLFLYLMHRNYLSIKITLLCFAAVSAKGTYRQISYVLLYKKSTDLESTEYTA